ncbi:MAG: thioredoxin family protein [Peptostreptococcaceae bacterium]|nr:thioredoxin family protein [Peptostreptococcaceae bacterium]
MKKIRMFTAEWCPHCTNAKGWLKELLEEEPKYRELEIERIDIDTQKEKLSDVDFYYVPTFYVEDEKIFEGVPSKEIIQEVLDRAATETR